jgi:hypothetical protein
MSVQGQALCKKSDAKSSGKAFHTPRRGADAGSGGGKKKFKKEKLKLIFLVRKSYHILILLGLDGFYFIAMRYKAFPRESFEPYISLQKRKVIEGKGFPASKERPCIFNLPHRLDGKNRWLFFP